MNPGEEGRGGGCSSCSFEAFVSRPVTRARREQERVTREHERAAGGCGEGCWQGCYERSINAAASIHPWTHISLTCRLPLASHSIPLSLSVLYRPLPSRPPSLAHFCTARLEALSIAREVQLASRYNERKRESPRFTYVFLCESCTQSPRERATGDGGSEMTDTTGRKRSRGTLYPRLGNGVAVRKRAARCSIDFLAKRRREGAHFCADT